MTKTSVTPYRSDVRTRDPWQWEMGRLSRDLDHLFNDFFGPLQPFRPFRSPERGEAPAFTPRCNVEDGEKAFVLTAEVPGFTREELTVDVQGETLTLRGEHRQEHENQNTCYVCRESARSSFVRTFHLPGELDVENVEAKLKDGILTLTLPKLHTAPHRQIEVSEA
jgi:HSP20 family protein